MYARIAIANVSVIFACADTLQPLAELRSLSNWRKRSIQNTSNSCGDSARLVQTVGIYARQRFDAVLLLN